MTLVELTQLCYEKIWQKNPLRLPEAPTVVYSPEEYETAVNQIADQYEMTSHYGSMLADAISEVYLTLYEELGLTREEAQQLTPDTQLPPRTNALAEKLSLFPSEMTEVDFQ